MTKYNFRSIKQDIAQDKWHQGYLIYGAEKYLIKQIIESIIDRFVQPELREIDLVKLSLDNDISSETIYKIKQELQTPAFLSERKIILLEKAGIFARAGKGQSESHKKLQKEFDQVVSLLNSNSCMILLEDTLDGRQKRRLKNWQEAGGIIVEVQYEELSVLRRWLQAKAQQKNLRVTAEAADSLIDRCESDMTQIEQEFNKAMLYAEHAKLEGIDLSIIELICKPDLRGTVFNLTDAVSAGQTKRALYLLDTLLILKEPLPLIRFMFTRHIRQLICAKELKNAQDIVDQVGVYPFVARGLIRQSGKMSFEELEYLHRLCFESDWKVKKGHMPDRLSFETLLIEASLTFASKVN